MKQERFREVKDDLDKATELLSDKAEMWTWDPYPYSIAFFIEPCDSSNDILY